MNSLVHAVNVLKVLDPETRRLAIMLSKPDPTPRRKKPGPKPGTKRAKPAPDATTEETPKKKPGPKGKTKRIKVNPELAAAIDAEIDAEIAAEHEAAPLDTTFPKV